MRALGSGIGTAWCRVAAIIASSMAGLIVGKYSLSYVFAMFGVVVLIGFVITALLATESKGRILEEVSP
jgi:putative MFS transporter